jgi:hypothetical protein
MTQLLASYKAYLSLCADAPSINMNSQASPQTSSTCSVPASDFRDLIDCILQLNIVNIRVFSEIALLQWRLEEFAFGSCERRDIATQIVSMASFLERHYRELDTHYGWVLASDHALVSKVLRSYFGENAEIGRSMSRLNAKIADDRSALTLVVDVYGYYLRN